jgi:hypothetical protein
MKKIVILALSAIFVANISAQEIKHEKCEGKKFTKEEKVEFDIKRLTNELMLSDQQAEKFAVTYREYAAKMNELFEANKPAKFEPGKVLTDAELDKLAKQRFEGFKNLADLQAKFYEKFRKDLSARQVEKIMRLDEPFGHKPCCGKHEGKFEGKAFGPKHDGPKFDGKEGPRPECDKKHGHKHMEGAPKPASKAE